MHGRYLYILTVLTRLAASTMIVPVALVAGMLSFPTTCQCGADHPHDHPLSGIAGHHHGEQRTTIGGPDTEVIRAGGDSITAPTSSGSSAPSLASVQVVSPTLLALPRVSQPVETIRIPDGLNAAPDVPPPQA